MTDIEDIWKTMRDNPQDKDIVDSFNRSCTAYNVHLLLQEVSEERKDMAELKECLQDMCTAYRMLVGLDGAFDTPLTNAERILRRVSERHYG